MRVRGAVTRTAPTTRRSAMSKGLDRKKDAKKKPTKTLKEKRAAKEQKKAGKTFSPH
jgi:hypothetical protein